MQAGARHEIKDASVPLAFLLVLRGVDVAGEERFQLEIGKQRAIGRIEDIDDFLAAKLKQEIHFGIDVIRRYATRRAQDQRCPRLGDVGSQRFTDRVLEFRENIAKERTKLRISGQPFEQNERIRFTDRRDRFVQRTRLRGT